MLLAWLDCWIRYVQDHHDFFALVGASIAGIWALLEFTSRRIAERKKLASELFDKFKTNVDTILATQMLDWIKEFDLGVDRDGQPILARVNTELLIESLKTLDEKRYFPPVEERIRKVFDGFLTELEMLNSYVESGMLKDKDLRPFIGYWIDLMNGAGAFIRPNLAEQLARYLEYFDYRGVLSLMKRFESTRSPKERSLEPDSADAEANG
jgi:hypothetical protein